MVDDPNNRDQRDRSKVVGEEDYEVDFLVKKHGITRAKAEALIKEFRGNRKKIEKALQAG